VICFVPACVKNDLEELEAREKQLINKYLTDNNISADTKTEGGIYFIEKVTGSGLTPVKDNYIIINYVGRYLEDGSIRETSYDSLKADWTISPDLENYLYGPAKIIYGYSMPGINEALSMMKEGGKASAIIPSDKANYDYRPLIYELELIRVVKNIKRFEDSVLTVYSTKHYGNEAQIDTFGIWTRINEAPASSNIFGTGDSLFFNFTGKLVDGFGDSTVADRIFDSNAGLAPVKYIYGQQRLTDGKMLGTILPKGLKTAIDSLQITNGMKFSVLMKYDQAWDKTGFLHPIGKYIVIPVYQNIEYDIEVTAIRPE
jgi:hypothetical protein